MSAADAVLDSTIRELIDELAVEKAPPIYTLTPEEARKTLLRAQSDPVEKPEAQIKDYNVSTTAGPLRLRSIRPIGVKTPTAVVLYFHGGGWVLGDAATHDRLVRELAAGTGATIVFVEYGRAPEHRYPVAIEQAYAATRYVENHADEFEVDSTRLAVAGDSAGGNMAAVVALLAKQRSGPRITGQLLFYPVTNADFDTASYNQFADGPWLTRLAMQWFWDQYLPDHRKRHEPGASPLHASKDQLAGLPRALVITAENDVLREEGEAYGRKLSEAGVQTVVTRYKGAIHDFVLLNRIAKAAPVRAALLQATEFLKGVLA
ncbi:MAG: alpha/beta hydrolase [Bryobacteraceae bacterium]